MKYYRKTRGMLFCILLLLPAFSVFGQKKPMITVLPFSSIEVPASVSMIISQLFETNLVNTGSYDVLSQNERDKILAAQAESMSGCSDESCAIEIGRMLAAEQIIIGTVAALGSKFIINAKIIDVTTSKTLGADMISATSVEDLDTACRTLTYSLVAKAIPSAAAAPPAPATTTQPTTKPGGTAAQPSTGTAGEQLGGEEPPAPLQPTPKKERPAREPRPAPVPGEFSLPGFLAHSGGILLRTTGNVLGSAAFGARMSSLDAWDDYFAAESGTDTLYSAYTDVMNTYTIMTYSSYGTWGAGAAVSAAAWLATDSISLSTAGRIAYAAGVLFETSGNVASMIAGNEGVATRAAYEEYMAAAEPEADTLYKEYLNLQDGYSTNRVIGLATCAAGGVLMAASPFLPGEKTLAAPSLLNRILMTVGSFLVSAGDFTSALAMNARINTQEAYDIYMTADASSADTYYENYLDTNSSYTALSYYTYGLWAAGGILTIVSLFVPMGTPVETANLPFSFSIQPASYGIGAEIHIKP